MEKGTKQTSLNKTKTFSSQTLIVPECFFEGERDQNRTINHEITEMINNFLLRKVFLGICLAQEYIFINKRRRFDSILRRISSNLDRLTFYGNLA